MPTVTNICRQYRPLNLLWIRFAMRASRIFMRPPCPVFRLQRQLPLQAVSSALLRARGACQLELVSHAPHDLQRPLVAVSPGTAGPRGPLFKQACRK